MGVPGLNKFLLSQCSSKAIRKINLHEMQNQSIVIDIHNYLYDFIHQGPTIIEPLYQLICNFALHNISPCFIFDGVPPKEKKDTLKARSLQKYTARQKYEELLITDPQQTVLLDTLKQQSTRLKPEDIAICKELLMCLNIPFYTATEESDPLCVAIVKHKYAWACMSQDMDMFLYGCNRVLRLHRNSFYLYDYEVILNELNIDAVTFREIFVLLGTDYSSVSTSLHPSVVIRAFFNYKKYREDIISFGLKPVPFVDWFHNKSVDKQKLSQICKMYSE